MTEIVLNTADREIIAVRILEAPRELIWKAWTEPDHVAKWWGPTGFTNTIEAMDVRPGGVWRFVMHGPDGIDYPNTICYVELKKPELLVYDHGEPGRPDLFRTSVTFESFGGKTKVTIQMLFPSAEARNQAAAKYGALEGLDQHIEKLAEYVANM